MPAKTKRKMKVPYPRIVDAVKREIERNTGIGITQVSCNVAAKLGVSDATVQHAFGRHTGKTIGQYMREQGVAPNSRLGSSQESRELLDRGIARLQELKAQSPNESTVKLVAEAAKEFGRGQSWLYDGVRRRHGVSVGAFLNGRRSINIANTSKASRRRLCDAFARVAAELAGAGAETVVRETAMRSGVRSSTVRDAVMRESGKTPESVLRRAASPSRKVVSVMDGPLVCGHDGCLSPSLIFVQTKHYTVQVCRTCEATIVLRGKLCTDALVAIARQALGRLPDWAHSELLA